MHCTHFCVYRIHTRAGNEGCGRQVWSRCICQLARVACKGGHISTAHIALAHNAIGPVP